MDIIEKMTGNVSENTACWNAVESSIKSHGVDVPEGTPKSDYAKKVDAVYEAGKKSEYDTFWDSFQQNGNRTSYWSCISGGGWTNDNFKPKYDMRPTDAYWMFRNAANIKLDLVHRLNELGVELDFSNCTDLQYTFTNTGFTRIGIVDARKTPGLLQTFMSSDALVTIEEIKLKEDGTTQSLSNYPFSGCSSLENINSITGYITSSVSFSGSPKLTHATLINIINALYDFVGAGSETSPTLTLGPANLNKLTEEEKAMISEKGWKYA